MKRWVWVCTLLAASGARAQAPPPADPDPWLSRDKALHFGLSAGFATVGYTLAGQSADSTEVRRLVVGGSFALAVGATKELLDFVARTGTPSWKDFTWDVAGTAVGLTVSWLVDHFIVQPAHLWSGATRLN
ncbi:MAG TPA: hypothetical protein VIG99_23765 [Myxococcaceae bacterium]|jgi:putative lipoprotein